VARVIWTERAAADLQAIYRFIARDASRAADLTIDRIVSSVNRLDQFPGSGRQVPETGRADLREVIVSPYRVIYLLRHDEVFVLTVHHGARPLRGEELLRG